MKKYFTFCRHDGKKLTTEEYRIIGDVLRSIGERVDVLVFSLKADWKYFIWDNEDLEYTVDTSKTLAPKDAITVYVDKL